MNCNWSIDCGYGKFISLLFFSNRLECCSSWGSPDCDLGNWNFESSTLWVVVRLALFLFCHGGRVECRGCILSYVAFEGHVVAVGQVSLRKLLCLLCFHPRIFSLGSSSGKMTN